MEPGANHGRKACLSMQEARRTAEEDFRSMLKMLVKDTLEPIGISGLLETSAADRPERGGYLANHNELKHAIMFLLNAAKLLSPDEVKFEISRLIFGQVTCCTSNDARQESALRKRTVARRSAKRCCSCAWCCCPISAGNTSLAQAETISRSDLQVTNCIGMPNLFGP